MSETILGIDLGTTNSEVAVIRDGQPFVIPGDDGDPILPSFVGLTDDGRLLVGKPARNQYGLSPERTIKSIKRRMGQAVKVPLGDQEYRPEEISAMILRALKDRATKFLGAESHKAVITVPAWFNDSQRQSTIEAGRLAGLEVVRILNEPTAAALIYNPNQSGSTRALVYDLGGGTFDVSIVQTEAGVVEVLASHGDTQLGGDDFDDVLMDHIAERFKEEHGIDLRENRTSKARISRAAEAAKRRLSDHPYTTVEEEFIAEKDGIALHLTMELSQEKYEELIRPLIDRTMDCLQKSLDDARLTAAQIDQVVLVGGSTRTPLVSRELETRLGKPAHREINPDLCVAMGAAVQGAIIAGQNIGAVLVDITPHSLGLKALANDPMGNFFSAPGFVFARIIPRGTPLPASRSESFSTVMDNQPKVQLELFQGENDNPDRNHRIGEFSVAGLSKAPRGNRIIVQMDLTLDGVLKVTAKEKVTGLQKQITIENANSQFMTSERETARTRLDDLWMNSFDAPPVEEEDDEEILSPTGEPLWDEEDDEDDGDEEEVPTLEPGPQLGQREGVQATALIEKAERLKAKASPEDQTELTRLIERIRTALADRNWAVVQSTSTELSDVMFYLEDA